jgi:hypothetical protein
MKVYNQYIISDSWSQNHIITGNHTKQNAELSGQNQNPKRTSASIAFCPAESPQKPSP